MATETIEEFLARGGEISKSSKSDVTLDELLKKEVLINDHDAKRIANLLSSTLEESLDNELHPIED